MAFNYRPSIVLTRLTLTRSTTARWGAGQQGSIYR